MAIYIELEYGGEIVASAPITITDNGHIVKAMVSARTASLQVGHIWRPSDFSSVGRGQSNVNSEVDQTLRILFRVDSTEDLVEFQDFIQLRSAIVLWLYTDDPNEAGSGLIISQAELEVPHSGLQVAFAELEVPAPLRLLISQAELEVPESGLYISQAELEVPESGLYISFAELQVPSDVDLAQEGGGKVLQEDGGTIKVED